MNKITLITQDWESMRYSINSFNDFENEIYDLVKNNIVQKTIIVLPSYVSKEERHKIHRFTKKNEIEPRSYGEHNNRYMEIIFSKKYIQTLFDKFEVQPAQNTPEPEQVVQLSLEEFKNRVLFDIMGVIDKHFSKEYKNYI